MRLLTRSDFDGLVCAVLLKEAGIMDEWRFVHPKDVQDGSVEVTANDILANVPYAPGCGMWFDHHSSERERLRRDLQFVGASRDEPSCARVIWDYYGGHETFPHRFEDMMYWVDRCDSGDLAREHIASPTGWVLLNFITDPRTGLGRFHDYRVSNYDLMMSLVDWCRSMDIGEILAQPDVAERTKRYFSQEKRHQAMLLENSRREGNLVITDLRDVETIYSGNRFAVYALFPECTVSMQAMWGRGRQNVVFTAGHSIIAPGCGADIGRIMQGFGGGGHRQVGTCQVAAEEAERVKGELIRELSGCA
ncbi:exopolyphosphatase [Desulfohalovibrio reitneri]|uniref:exopolyphosphatase n=1 Tax=Desulfohalovibrio reitneri TaxID=1307759 RepID=UPI0004A745AA|nr:exopolyphosphatase [Desulfohalovibrio reitneri]